MTQSIHVYTLDGAITHVVTSDKPLPATRIIESRTKADGTVMVPDMFRLNISGDRSFTARELRENLELRDGVPMARPDAPMDLINARMEPVEDGS